MLADISQLETEIDGEEREERKYIVLGQTLKDQDNLILQMEHDISVYEAEKPLLEAEIADIKPQVAQAQISMAEAEQLYDTAMDAYEDHVEKMNSIDPALEELENENFDLLDQLVSQN